jgi:DNA-binding IclR family transcriptional regulator
MSQNKNHVNSVIKAFKILNIVGEERQIGVSEVVRKTGLKKTTVARLLKTLQYVSMIEQDPVTKVFSLGKGAIELGSKIWATLDFSKVAYPIIQEFVKREGVSVLVSVLNGTNVIYIEKFLAVEPFQISTKVGETRPVYCCAAGKIMLAFVNPKLRKQVIGLPPLKAFTDNTLTSLKSLEKDLELAIQRGFSLDIEESIPGICSVAAPIFNRHADVEAAVSIPRMTSNITKSQLIALGKRLAVMANEISRRLGGK